MFEESFNFGTRNDLLVDASNSQYQLLSFDNSSVECYLSHFNSLI